MNATRAVVLCVIACLVACASNKAGMKSPELPAKYWLEEEVPGIRDEHRDGLQAAAAFHDPDKVFSFDDCVYLTMQQSPALVASAVSLEIQRLALINTVWQYFPEPRMNIRVTNNVTRYNENTKDTPGDYGRPVMRPQYYGYLMNPVVTYFEQQAKRIMINLAISLHRKAVGEAIYKIARAYLDLQAKRKIAALQKELLPVVKEGAAYWQRVEEVEGAQGTQLYLARQRERDVELLLEETAIEESMQLSDLKVLAGVGRDAPLNVNTDKADAILAGFDGTRLKWEERWPVLEDEYLLRGQVELADYNIMVAWAQYMPLINVDIDTNPPSGQYQPSGGTSDYFLHFNFDIPLIDWGVRYRGVQVARMKKAEAFHDVDQKRAAYSGKWLQAKQKAELANTELKLAKTRFETAEMQNREAEIGYKAGTVEFPEVLGSREAGVKAAIRLAEADLAWRRARLDWMYLAGVLQERYLRPPAGDFL
ncbi:MAG: TolC family protein [Desulfovibrio sp.]|nr:TolC family protein [Desulfovibrio sp.]